MTESSLQDVLGVFLDSKSRVADDTHLDKLLDAIIKQANEAAACNEQWSEDAVVANFITSLTTATSIHPSILAFALRLAGQYPPTGHLTLDMKLSLFGEHARSTSLTVKNGWLTGLTATLSNNKSAPVPDTLLKLAFDVAYVALDGKSIFVKKSASTCLVACLERAPYLSKKLAVFARDAERCDNFTKFGCLLGILSQSVGKHHCAFPLEGFVERLIVNARLVDTIPVDSLDIIFKALDPVASSVELDRILLSLVSENLLKEALGIGLSLFDTIQNDIVSLREVHRSADIATRYSYLRDFLMAPVTTLLAEPMMVIMDLPQFPPWLSNQTQLYLQTRIKASKLCNDPFAFKKVVNPSLDFYFNNVVWEYPHLIPSLFYNVICRMELTDQVEKSVVFIQPVLEKLGTLSLDALLKIKMRSPRLTELRLLKIGIEVISELKLSDQRRLGNCVRFYSVTATFYSRHGDNKQSRKRKAAHLTAELMSKICANVSDWGILDECCFLGESVLSCGHSRDVSVVKKLLQQLGQNPSIYVRQSVFRVIANTVFKYGKKSMFVLLLDVLQTNKNDHEFIYNSLRILTQGSSVGCLPNVQYLCYILTESVLPNYPQCGYDGLSDYSHLCGGAVEFVKQYSNNSNVAQKVLEEISENGSETAVFQSILKPGMLVSVRQVANGDYVTKPVVDGDVYKDNIKALLEDIANGIDVIDDNDVIPDCY